MVIFKEGNIEAHARAAVSAGLEIAAENVRLNEDACYAWGKVDLHMGINSGQAMVGATRMTSITGERWAYTASGLVTVTAARIGALSRRSKLFVGPSTHSYIKHLCECDFIGTKKVKNVKEPIPVYWVKCFLDIV
ncbi:MAG: adenylate/guanylate cyclase domain-containing protein [Desulfohalobiaceae bacterium]|nr:adenylate/guanylate cyclase domain-containing protein [Desulfohalobiaceae bacterium]